MIGAHVRKSYVGSGSFNGVVESIAEGGWQARFSDGELDYVTAKELPRLIAAYKKHAPSAAAAAAAAASPPIRVTVALDGRGRPKILSLSPSQSWSSVLESIGKKLGIGLQGSVDRSRWLVQIGDAIVDETSDLRERDELVLVIPEADDDEVQDVTAAEKARTKGRSAKKSEAAEELSSDDESESDADDGSDRLEDESDIYYSESDDGDDSDYDSDNGGAAAAAAKKPKEKKPVVEKAPPVYVHIEEKDLPARPGKHEGIDFEKETGLASRTILLTSKHSDIDSAEEIKSKIRKLLNTGFSSSSNEHEAKRALRLSEKLMKKHNIERASLQVEASGGLDEDGDLKGGMVTVQVWKDKNSRQAATLAPWMRNLASWAVVLCFDVKCFTRCARGKRPKTEVAFYGILDNAQVAAYVEGTTLRYCCC